MTFFNRRQQPIALSLLLDSSASMEDKLPMLQTAAVSFVKRLKSNDIAQMIDFDSRVEIRQAFTGNQPELEQAINRTAAGGSTSLHNAIYIALKELRKIRAVSEEDVRRQALIVFSDGEDTSSLISFDEVLDLAKRSETAVYTIALRGADSQSKGFREAEFVMRQLAQETGGRAFFPGQGGGPDERLRPDRRRAGQPVHAGLYAEERQARRGVASHRGADLEGQRHTSRETGLLRPDGPVNLLPLALYAAAGVAYAIHFARRSPTVGRAATTLLLLAVLTHTFAIGMQTMEVRHVPFANPSRAVSTFVWLLALSYLYLEITADERAMGVFVPPILVALQLIPAIYPGIENADPVLDSPWFWVHVASLLFAYASFALAGALGVTYMLQFKEIKKKHLGYFYTRLPSLLTLDAMNLAGRHRRVGVPDDRRGGGPHLDGAGPAVRADRSESPGDVGGRSQGVHRPRDVGPLLLRARVAQDDGLVGPARGLAVCAGVRGGAPEFPAHQLLRQTSHTF